MQVSITSPASGAVLKAGSKGVISLTATYSSWTDIAGIVTGKVIIRDVNGNTVWEGDSPFHSYQAEIDITFPTAPGKYTIEGDILGLVKSWLGAVSTSTFEIVA